MITSFDHHWDNLSQFKGETWFTYSMIKWRYSNGLPNEAVNTTFVKLNKQSKVLEHAWVGTSSNFRHGESPYGKKCIWFKVNLTERIDNSSVSNDIHEGWFGDENKENKLEIKLNLNQLEPPFFAEVVNTNSWKVFEEKGQIVLKLLGINNIHKIHHSDNKGKADGFFQFNELSVLFDFTLENDFILKKAVQIENFRQQLLKDDYTHKQKLYSLKKTSKQVWIITKNDSKLIRKHDGVTIKEISINSLLQLYTQRLTEEMDDEELLNRLKNL